MQHMDETSDDTPPAVVPKYIVRVAVAVVEYELLERNRPLAIAIGALGSSCVHCAVECTHCCPYCGTTVCPADRAIHVSTKCLLFNELPSAARASDNFHLRGLARILRNLAPETHPIGRPLCASGDPLQDAGQAAFMLDNIERILYHEIPQLATYEAPDSTMHRDAAVRIIHESAAGLAAFGALMDKESQRGVRTAALGGSLLGSSCCPRLLAQIRPPPSTVAWRLLCLTYNLPENAHRPLCSSGDFCLGRKIKNRDKRPYNQPLRAMRSPAGELLSDETDTCGGLCLLCMSAEISQNLHSRLLWQDETGMFRDEFMIWRGNYRIVVPVLDCLVVDSYMVGDTRVYYVNESSLRLPNARLF